MSAPHPAQAALRLEQLGRAAIAEEEFRLRVATFAARGVGLDARSQDDGPLRVLAAGVADRRFLALSNALTAAGVEVIAAPTPTPPSTICTKARSTPPSCGAPRITPRPCPSRRA